MKIGKPTAMPEESSHGKHKQIWEEAEKLKSGLALPLEFDTKLEALYFRNGNHAQAKRKGLSLRQRGSTVYVTRLNGRG